MAENVDQSTADQTQLDKKKCGIIMPISPHPDYPIGHWQDVLNIIREAIPEDEFEADLVSNDEAIGLIHERIVTNIYFNEMTVCDVSSKNANVMFELGLRLAFDKPVIIIKDDRTNYSFDTGVIEHLTYPASLRFGDIVTFKHDLTRKIKATYTKSQQSGFSPFLQSFGKNIVPAAIHKENITETEFLIKQVSLIRKDVQALSNRMKSNSGRSGSFPLYTKEEQQLLDSIQTELDFYPDNDLRDESLVDQLSKKYLTLSREAIKSLVGFELHRRNSLIIS